MFNHAGLYNRMAINQSNNEAMMRRLVVGEEYGLKGIMMGGMFSMLGGGMSGGGGGGGWGG